MSLLRSLDKFGETFLSYTCIILGYTESHIQNINIIFGQKSSKN